jgi:hypothetical protein
VTRKIVADFPFIGSNLLEQQLDIRKTQREELRRQLQSPLYWWQFPNGKKIFWNINLVRDYLLNGNTPAHQALVEEYLKTLPTAK